MSGLVTLVAGDARVVVAPAVGGAVVAFSWRNNAVLRVTPDDAIASGRVREFASYPLVPFSNRIANATLATRDGRSHALIRNFGDHPHTIHGVGWQREWNVDAVEAQSVCMSHAHRPESNGPTSWPFAYDAVQSITVRADAHEATLTLTLAIRNVDSTPFPFGLGWHPFFPKDAITRLGFHAATYWATDDTRLPTTSHDASGDAAFDPPRVVGDTSLDHVYAGWDGRARLEYPERNLAVTIEADTTCAHLVVYAPPAGSTIAVEPVTHMTDAFNRFARGETGTGTRLLTPGSAYSCTMRIAVTPST
ncbi:MAG TPA: aldose 1-epimerase [Casimicrobiaceae bacterium]|nr:aldose 1-epimerase [Casimicrobiaceae bacterium]